MDLIEPNQISITEIEISELQGYGKIFYSKGTALIVSIKEARHLSLEHSIIIEEI